LNNWIFYIEELGNFIHYNFNNFPVVDLLVVLN
jgi:hypothetical protein